MITLLRLVFTRRLIVISLIILAVTVLCWMFNVVYAWLWLSIAGLTFSVLLIRDSAKDVVALHRSGEANGRLLAAHSRGIRETVRASTEFLYILAGLAAIGILPREIIVPILVYGAAALMVNSAVDLATRPYLYHTRKGEPTIPMPEDQGAS